MSQPGRKPNEGWSRRAIRPGIVRAATGEREDASGGRLAWMNRQKGMGLVGSADGLAHVRSHGDRLPCWLRTVLALGRFGLRMLVSGEPLVLGRADELGRVASPLSVACRAGLGSATSPGANHLVGGTIMKLANEGSPIVGVRLFSRRKGGVVGANRASGIGGMSCGLPEERRQRGGDGSSRRVARRRKRADRELLRGNAQRADTIPDGLEVILQKSGQAIVVQRF